MAAPPKIDVPEKTTLPKVIAGAGLTSSASSKFSHLGKAVLEDVNCRQFLENLLSDIDSTDFQTALRTHIENFAKSTPSEFRNYCDDFFWNGEGKNFVLKGSPLVIPLFRVT